MFLLLFWLKQHSEFLFSLECLHSILNFSVIKNMLLISLCLGGILNTVNRSFDLIFATSKSQSSFVTTWTWVVGFLITVVCTWVWNFIEVHEATINSLLITDLTRALEVLYLTAAGIVLEGSGYFLSRYQKLLQLSATFKWWVLMTSWELLLGQVLVRWFGIQVIFVVWSLGV